MPFIWGYKTNRIAKSHLQKSKMLGGFSLPVFQHYYWATNLRALIYWQNQSPQVSSIAPKWLQFESQAVKNSSLSALLFSKENPSDIVGDNFILENSLQILKQVKRVLTVPELSVHSPICFNHNFIPSQSDTAFTYWREKGLITFADLYIDNHFAAFNELKEAFSLPQAHFFRYLQVRHFVQNTFNNFESLPQEHCFYALMKQHPNTKHLISKFVSLFSKSSIPSTNHIKSSWEVDLGVELSDEIWNEGLRRIHSGSINSRLQLVQFKVMHRLHYSKVKMNKMYPTVSDICDRCSTSRGTLGHTFWSCPRIAAFWKDIFAWYSRVYHIHIDPDPLTVLFGCSEASLSLPYSIQQTIMLGTLIAKRIILSEWKTSVIPSFNRWLNEFVSLIYLERLRCNKLNGRATFEYIWGPISAHLDLT